ncbi:MAG: glycosyltransferase family 4 protein [Acidobacteria bacterium]|nr:glycosyltransferase family 4 protein [Acidobacteriota bacterium]
MRVLFSAFSAYSPYGSESLVGYNYARVLARRHELTVITCKPTDLSTEIPGVRAVHTIDLGGRDFNEVSRASLLSFEMRQWGPASRARRAGVDLIHRVNPCSLADPTFLAFMNRPLAIGPVLTNDDPPVSFREITDREISRYKADTAWFRRLRPHARLSSVMFGAMLHSWTHLKKATRILVGSEATLQKIPARFRGRCEPIVYAGVEHEVFTPGPPIARGGAGGPVKLLTVGRLMPYKGIELLLRMCGRLRARCDFTLTIVGRGSPWYTGFLESVADRESIGDRVRFLAPIPRAELIEMYRSHDVFCFPSLADTYGIALVEAMSCGLPVVVSDCGGPAEIAGLAGARIPVVSPEQYIAEGAEILGGILESPARLAEMGRASRARVLERHDWGKIGARIEEIYSGLA